MSELDEEKNPLELSPPNPLLRPVGLIFTIIIAFIFALIVGIGGWDRNPANEVPRETLPPVENTGNELLPSTSTQNPPNTSCSTVQEDEVQSCCAQWAINNDMMTPQCVGTWELSAAGECSWQCATN